MTAEDTVICVCEGVRYSQLCEAGRQGLGTGAFKRETRAGMGECQGRLCQHIIVPVLHRYRLEANRT